MALETDADKQMRGESSIVQRSISLEWEREMRRALAAAFPDCDRLCYLEATLKGGTTVKIAVPASSSEEAVVAAMRRLRNGEGFVFENGVEVQTRLDFSRFSDDQLHLTLTFLGSDPLREG